MAASPMASDGMKAMGWVASSPMTSDGMEVMASSSMSILPRHAWIQTHIVFLHEIPICY